MSSWQGYYLSFLEQDRAGTILPLTPVELSLLARTISDLNGELTIQLEIEDARKGYLAAAAANLAYGANYYEPDAISGVGELVGPPPPLGYTEVSDEPECSGNNPLTMLNWRVEDGGGAYGLC